MSADHKARWLELRRWELSAEYAVPLDRVVGSDEEAMRRSAALARFGSPVVRVRKDSPSA
jgi:hypothetical protein